MLLLLTFHKPLSFLVAQTLHHPCELSNSLVMLFTHSLICVIDCLKGLVSVNPGAVSSQDARSLRRSNLKSADKGREFRISSAMVEETEESNKEDIRGAFQEVSAEEIEQILHAAVSFSLSNNSRYIAASATKWFLRSGPCLARSTNETN